MHDPTVDPTVDFTQEHTYRQTRAPVERAVTLIPDAYRSDEFYRIEQERVFSKGWVCVGYTSQVRETGDTLTAVVAGQHLFVTRDRAGELRAFFNVCRHRGSLLVLEDGRHDVIRCPYHSWGYSLEGKLLGTPFFKGLDVPEEERAAFDMSEVQGFCKDDYGLLPVAVGSWGCFVFVNLAPQPRPLLEWLGDLPQRYAGHPLGELELVHRKTFHVRANWKLIAENFMEYYHLPWVHPELCNISGFKDHHRYQGPGMYTGMCTSPLSYDPNNPLSAKVPPLPGLSETDSRNAYWVLLFPNIALFLLPNHLFMLMLRPDGPRQTIEYADLLLHPYQISTPGTSDKFQAIFDFWAFVNDQDIAAVERVQQGIETRAYPGGRMCYRFEEPIHRFQNMVADAMVGAMRVPAGDL